MKLYKSDSLDFDEVFESILSRGKMDIDKITPKVQLILNEIKADKDKALCLQIDRFDGWSPKDGADLLVHPEEMQKAYEDLSADLKDSLHTAYNRIKSFHEKQLPKSWMEYEKNGTVLGQKVTAVGRAGLYIPGGKAAYPSSLLMNAIPAIVAGVDEIIVCTPAPKNILNPILLAAMHLCGVKKAFKVGGASAIGAMAFGTQTIPKVDVITGPGNIYVATAKKLVFGEVNIDMIAGPSEIGIIADSSARAKFIAIDLLSQAEHDEMASSILITPDLNLANEVKKEIDTFLSKLEREKIARESVEKRGAIIITKDIKEATTLMNKIAPEHLEIMTENPHLLLPYIKNAGAIFLGEYTPEPIGDYIAGPNHTLPTGGTAKFYSPLGVENFMKKSSIIGFSKDALMELGASCANLANCEGLTAHQKAIEERLKN